MSSKVQLYIYDLSRGFASQMSTMFLGKKIDGIWHTAVVCFGREYFYGGGGIENCLPGKLPMLGAPNDVVDLGDTQLTDDVFQEYLFSVGNEQFRPEKYDLFDHNCNTFSNEVAQFLTGSKVPSYIMDLPKEIENTPFGPMIRSMVDGIRGPEENQRYYREEPSGASDLLSSFAAPQNTQGHSSRNEPTHQSRESIPDVALLEWPSGEPITYNIEVSDCIRLLKQEIPESTSQLKDFEDYYDFYKNSSGDKINSSSTKEPIESIIDSLDSIFKLLEVSSDSNIVESFLKILTFSFVCREKSIISDHKGSTLLIDVIRKFKCKPDNTLSILHMATNIFSKEENRNEIINESSNNSIFEEIRSFCLTNILEDGDDLKVKEAAIALAHNISLSKVNEDTAIELSSALLHWINQNNDGSNNVPVQNCVKAVKNFIQCSSQVKELAEMIIDVKLLESREVVGK